MVTYLLTVKLLLRLSKIFVSVPQNVHVNNHNANPPSNHENPIAYLSKAFIQPFPTINLKGVSSKEIEDITKSLKIKNSHGYHGITTKILKLSMHYTSSPLTFVTECYLLAFSQQE